MPLNNPTCKIIQSSVNSIQYRQNQIKLSKYLIRFADLQFIHFRFKIYSHQQTMDKPCIVIDNGSGTCKVGLAGEDAPRSKFHTVVGKPKMPSIMVGMDQKQAYIGQQAEAKRGVLKLSNPINHGVVENWQNMTKIWHHSFYNELKVTPEQHPCLLTEAPKNPLKNREKTAQIMFQTFNVPSLYLAIQSVLALYSTGRTTGLVLDSGEGLTSTVPIYEGYAIPLAIERNDFAGKQITRYLHKLLQQVGMKFSFAAEYNTLSDIKQKHCYVAQDFANQVSDYLQTNRNDCKYELPDGEVITLGNQRFRCPQIMFKPEKYNIQMPALHEMVYQSIMKCDLDVRKDLYTNIVLSGGSTMFPGMPERLMKELSGLVPSNIKTNVVGPAEREYLAWIGGSILGSMATFQSMWISKNEYVQNGSALVHRKCF